MDILSNLLLGLSVALTPENLLYAVLGCVFGTLIGVLPGIGPSAGTALLIPLTARLPPTGAIIMLTAIFYGTQYGGTITSILLNVPGEAASAITCIDGHQMAKKGRAGAALSVAAIGSFIGGTFATIALVCVAGPLTQVALEFGPVEFFALMVLGLSLLMGLAGDSMVKALMMGAVGLLLAMIGMDPVRGAPRFTFGMMELLDGLNFVPVIMGLFGLSEILENAEKKLSQSVGAEVGSLIPSRQEVRDSAAPVIRGSIVGTLLGLVPGMTGSMSSFLSYSMEKKLSKHPERFGHGAVEGVAGPETANNAHANGALIPLFTLGIPASPTVAVLMGAFMMNGLIPGPFLFREQPALVWGVIASFFVGNVILVILNLPLISIWVKILKIPYSILFAVILAFMVIGAYGVENSIFDVAVMLISGVAAYLLKKFDFPMAPIVLTLILGPVMERALRRSMEMSQGDISILFSSPLAVVLLILSAVIIVTSSLKFIPARKWSGGGDAEV
ncbi:tripartite tricarboxylate transporter permease [Xanthobacteraceae bacterium Astr-EGSB]|uniref:tripartite tricarboxylate transporter permease n=1 Tax=Astrobacterium formosum TaxID=3069710 RepID=UPI0027B210BB|nr:tripartite tricarboxylate transporter permease [Xanthobacteraceae bacterium Astr-EGSB]